MMGNFLVSVLDVSRNNPKMVRIEVRKVTQSTWNPLLDFSHEVLLPLVLWLFLFIRANVKNKISEF